MITIDQLAAATAASPAAAHRFYQHLVKAMGRFSIDTPDRAAAFLATVSVESFRLSKTEEDLYYKDADRLVRIYPRAFKTAGDARPYVRNPSGLSEKLYKGYHGRGLIQLSWERNYRAASNALGYDYVGNPRIVANPEHAAMTAAWYWNITACNAAADRCDMKSVTRLVNGPALLHLDERMAQFKIAREVLSA